MLPAYAGMILGENNPRTGRNGAPRVCGDDPGAAGHLHDQNQVLPAYAGMILLPLDNVPVLCGAPRVCGDDPVDQMVVAELEPCSPRMRG